MFRFKKERQIDVAEIDVTEESNATSLSSDC